LLEPDDVPTVIYTRVRASANGILTVEAVPAQFTRAGRHAEVLGPARRGDDLRRRAGWPVRAFTDNWMTLIGLIFVPIVRKRERDLDYPSAC